MKTENFSFLSKDRRTKIHAVRWSPDSGSCHAVLQITHGMVEYIERYRPFAEYLTDRGFLVVGHDHVGHGQSVSFKGDWGFFRKDHPSDLLIEDIHTLYERTKQENPGLPYFIFGHSMGSFLLRKYLTRYGEGLQGAIICGTGYTPVLKALGGLAVIKVLQPILGQKYRSSFVAGLAFGSAYKHYDMTGAVPENSWLTKDVEIVKQYYSTPACTFTFTLNGYQGLVESVLFVCRQKNVDRIPKNLPLFVVSGAKDPVGDAGKGVRKFYGMLEKGKRPDLQLKLYENDRHEILNETDRKTVFADLYHWMEDRI